jgi:hypothetical protein
MIRIKGIVIPIDWDSKGTILHVAIATPDEEEYTVENGSLTSELIGHIRKKVEVSGIVKVMDQKKIIQLKQIHHYYSTSNGECG